ncbi:cytochrome b/b6 domain-containing protein [Microbacterium cremeum]|uniref:cytochrome b/b6 domain-containing protein n=1 Tax=Microbacterium cremeum TaxID=2782169 RepID=UPI003080FC1E
MAQHAGTDASTPRVVTPEPAAAPAPAEASATHVAQHAGTDASTPRVVTPEPAAAAARTLRRGLPRVPGGEPWPPAEAARPPASGDAPVAPPEAVGAAIPAAPAAAAPAGTPAAATEVAQHAGTDASTPRVATPESASIAPAGAATRPLRRGLPRVPGGDPWPPEGLAPAAPVAQAAQAAQAAPAAPAAEVAQHAETRAPTPRVVTPEPATAEPVTPEPATAEPATAEPATPAAPVLASTPTGVPLSQPLTFTRTVWPGAAARTRPAPKPEPERIGPFTRLQWAGAIIVGGGGLLVAAGLAVLFVRWLLSMPWGQDFLAAYPGEYHLPAGAPVGFPAWLGWQHFFNVFLMVLIIRSGLRVRTEKRPSVFWSPRNNGRRKISLNLWFHQSLDILWLVNGVIFVALLFLTGQWMRIVPTSWEVFPNALSATLQYVSLDWPTENGWVNYNSLQQLAYFATVFIAAPLAAITGVRMSGVWPKNATGLSKAYPVEWARAVHFPVMLYFVAFIAVHVFLVLATGALRNLNHMYAAQGSADPDAYAANWTGFWLFVASLVVIAAAWIAARPLILAPIARVFGKVSGR